MSSNGNSNSGSGNNDGPADRDGRRKIAVLGAGPAGLAAAFALTRTGEMRARHAVTVYQMGWRAGGKSATGRAMDKGWRIEQNGSHYLFGCYGNSFALVREAFEVLHEHGVEGFGDYREQFVPRNLLVFKQGLANGTWVDWFRYFPESTAWPDRGGKYPPLSHFFFVAVQLLLGFVLGLLIDTKATPARSVKVIAALFKLNPFHRGPWARFVRITAVVVSWLIDGPAFVFSKLAGALWKIAPAGFRSLVWGALRVTARATGKAARHIACKLDRTPGYGKDSPPHGPINLIHRVRILLELGATGILGVIDDRLWEAGRLEQVDDLDFRQWLLNHGASPEAAYSALCKTWYDAVVAYEDGDEKKPRISAGVTLHALFRAILTYKGAFAYQMTHEIGDSFIAPIVKALQLRGVEFKFFHRVRDLIPGAAPSATATAAGEWIQQIVVEEQIPADRRQHHRLFVTLEPTGGDSGAPPQPRKVWPNRPVFDDEPGPYETPVAAADPPLDSHLAPERPGGRHVLTRGTDFHDIVLALPPGVISGFPGISNRPGWSDMLSGVKSVDTQSLRLWFTKTLSELGWPYPGPILSGFAYPYSTWEDNDQNRGNECFGKFSARQEPSAIATLFGPFKSDPGAREPAQQGMASEQALRFYMARVDALWPALAAEHPEARFSALLAPEGLHGRDRFDWQYTRANVGPLEAYVLALPGTLRHRMRPDETGFRNLLAAGEWTRNGFEVGCVEGAIISGLLAAQAICDNAAGLMPIIGEEDATFGPFRPGTARLSKPRKVKGPERLTT